jgi:hypothetical protein
MSYAKQTEESKRLEEARSGGILWRRWGPYLSERQWGTVREDYSDNGDAWSYFSHDQASHWELGARWRYLPDQVPSVHRQ